MKADFLPVTLSNCFPERRGKKALRNSLAPDMPS
jgi:hypothetical protein